MKNIFIFFLIGTSCFLPACNKSECKELLPNQIGTWNIQSRVEVFVEDTLRGTFSSAFYKITMNQDETGLLYSDVVPTEDSIQWHKFNDGQNIYLARNNNSTNVPYLEYLKFRILKDQANEQIFERRESYVQIFLDTTNVNHGKRRTEIEQWTLTPTIK
jgi:hypothetical protein